MQPFQLLVSFVLHSSASDELRLLCQSSPGKDVFFLKFSPLVAAVIVIRCIIPKGIAGPLSVVKLHIALDHVDEFFPAFTLIKFEIDVLFGQLPASSGFIW